MKLQEIKKAIEELTNEEKKEFFSEVVPDICDESLTREGCRLIFEKKLSGSRYLESFDELHEMQEKKS
jgi:Na+-translocating ferredoxin:NAD+ oxidoreductase RnfG subunit